MQKADLLQFHLDLSIDKSTRWQDVGETTAVGQDGMQALEISGEVHIG